MAVRGKAELGRVWFRPEHRVSRSTASVSPTTTTHDQATLRDATPSYFSIKASFDTVSAVDAVLSLHGGSLKSYLADSHAIPMSVLLLLA